MQQKTKNYICPVSSRLSFDETLDRVIGQLELEALADGNGNTPPMCTDICLIVTDVYMRNPKGSVIIGGELLDVETVQGIYRQLRAEHVQLVIDNFSKVTHEIKNKRQYLRTALYNSVLECNTHYENLYNAHFGGEGG